MWQKSDDKRLTRNQRLFSIFAFNKKFKANKVFLAAEENKKSDDKKLLETRLFSYFAFNKKFKANKVF